MAKFFTFMFIEDSWLSRLFDLAIYALNPRERWPAHVTLAGPFSSKRDLPRHLSFHQQISTLGAGQFRSDAQNTVFLHVGSLDMEARTNKPDYGRSISHLSLYNGLDHDLGDLFFENLQQVRAYMTFYATGLHVVESNKQLGFGLRSRIDLTAISETRDYHIDDFEHMSNDDRVKIAIAAIREAVSSRYDRPLQSKMIVI